MIDQSLAVAEALPFVGRERELAALEAALGGLEAGAGRAVLVGGEPGIGKTSLIQRALHADGAERRECWAWLDHTVGLPALWPWVQVLRTLDAEAALARTDGDEVVVLEEVETALRSVEATRPLAIVIEDLQWADRPSLLAFLRVARLVADAPVILVGTYRDSELSPRHPLTEQLVELERLPHVDHLRLRALRDEEVREAARAALGAAGAVESVVTRSDGNPYFMVELVRAIGERGVAAPSELIPTSVRQALELRFSDRSEACRVALGLAALIGRDFDAELLGSALGDHEAALVAVDEAIEAALVVEAGDGYRFVHALMQDTVRASLSRVQRARMHASIADALSLRSGRSHASDESELAPHLIEAAMVIAERASEAVVLASRVADRYADQGAWEQAARLYRSALVLGERHGLGAGNLTDGELLLRLGRCYLSGADPRHLETHRRAFASFRDAGDRDGMARAVLESAPASQLNQGALPDVEEAIAAFEGSGSDVLARLLVHRAVTLWDAGADAAAQQARELAERLDLDEVRALLLDRETHGAFLELRFDDMGTAASGAFEVLDRLGRSDEAAHMLADEAWPRLLGGGLDEAAQLADRALRYALDAHSEPYEQVATAQLAAVALLRDDRDTLEALADAHPSWMAWLPFLLAWRADLEGRYTDALVLVPSPVAIDPEPNFARTHAARARIAWRAGDERLARREFERWRTLLPQTVMLGFSRPQALPEIDDAVVPLGDPELWAELDTQLDEWSAMRIGAAVPGSLDYLRGVLTRALDRPDDAGAHFERGRAWSQSEHSPLEEARCLAGLGLVARDAGATSDARTKIGTALAVFEERRADGYAAWARHEFDATETAPPGVRLTPRELDVMRLLARGATNAEIAKALVVSPHTVANHLKRIRAKTGSENRTAAAAYAVRLGLDRD